MAVAQAWSQRPSFGNFVPKAIDGFFQLSWIEPTVGVDWRRSVCISADRDSPLCVQSNNANRQRPQ